MRTPHVMTRVLVALLPGLGAMTYVWGIGIVYNVALLSIICLATEAAAVFAKQALGNAPGENTVKKWSGHLFDGSTLVTAWLIAICLPPFTNFGILSLAGLAAIGLAKHAYGGLGRNIFNPAMVGYAVILVSFPSHLALWPASSDGGIDHLTGATILSDFRYRVGITTTEFTSLFAPNLQDQRLIAYSFLAGGLFLLVKKLLAWRIPVSMLAGVGFAALFGYDQGSSMSSGSAVFHWTSGGFIAAAFFVATDPVTHPRGARPQIIFGFTVGLMTYLIRAYGTFPDGIAFAILFANCLTPLMNRMATRHTTTPKPDA
ncbi:RnfABCDGE type electron transport complex subunit D [bacterium]|nr:RnfABCDGE type electron transport complex subunit D [bacterium]